MYMRELLFSVTRDDFTIQTFRAGGKGGQKQNKTDSGVRCIHNASGAVGEGRDERSQLQNKKNAFKRWIALAPTIVMLPVPAVTRVTEPVPLALIVTL